MDIGSRIRDLRTQNRMTLEDVARRLGITRATAQRYESGAIKVPSDKIEQLAELFGVSPGYFFGWKESEEETDLIGAIRSGIRESDEEKKLALEAEKRILRICRRLSREGREYLLQQAEVAEKLYGGKQ